MRFLTRRRAAIGLLLVLALVRFLTFSYASLTITKGDFYWSQPPKFAKTLNPTLWASQDLPTKQSDSEDDMSYPARVSYIYGPTIYLTLFPTVFLNSYHAIALFLLVLYGALLIVSPVPLIRAIGYNEGANRLPLLIGLGATLLFYPALQAMQGREFEVVVYLLTIVALGLLVRGREAAGSAVLAYTAWFKYWPLIFLFYFVARRRYRAVASFVATSALLLLVTHLTLGLENFYTVRFVKIVTKYFQTVTRSEVYARELDGPVATFCRDWGAGGGANTSVRWALCGLTHGSSWISAQAAFYSLCALIGTVTLAGFVSLERRDLTAHEEKWRSIIEVSLLLIIGAFFLHNHYYYLIVLLIPIIALCYRYWPCHEPGDKVRLALVGMSYVLLSAFVLPASVLDRILGIPSWPWYVGGHFYLWGGLILIGLLLREYLRLAFSFGRQTAWTPAASRA